MSKKNAAMAEAPFTLAGKSAIVALADRVPEKGFAERS